MSEDPIALVLAEAAYEHRGIPALKFGMVSGYRCACGAQAPSVTEHRIEEQAAALRRYFASEEVRNGLQVLVETEDFQEDLASGAVLQFLAALHLTEEVETRG